MLLPKIDVFCYLLLCRPTVTWNPFVLHDSIKRNMLLMVTLSIRLSFNRLLLRTNQNACMIQIITCNALIFPAEPLLSGQPILSCGHSTIPVGDRLIQV